MPFVVIAAFALAAITGNTGSSTPSSSGAPLPAISASAPPQATAQAANCAKVLAALPVSLGKLTPRVVHTKPDTPNVVAWGDPAVVLSCGAGRPKDLVPGSSAKFVVAGPAAGPWYDVTTAGGGDVFTTVDRAAYISISVPAKYPVVNVMPPLSDAIAKALPAVCDGSGTAADPDDLCTRRK
ncbi:DUF3515 family protein [uncultured Jatrophihabitans sp.]|uniref:DUF3515 family protein n=1 Tax=uncultured Jatrophihabitans sp. TaxID=1610747 RepID=UPI0035CC41F2